MIFGSGVKEELQVLKDDPVGNFAHCDSGANVDACLDLSQLDSLRLVGVPMLHVVV